MKKLTMILMVATLGILMTVSLTGCKEKSSPPAEPSSEQDMVKQAVDTATADVDQAKVDVKEQTTCPVMEGKINKEIFVEYKGKKVYFCCPGCEETFLKDPEKYISKLPQFQE